MLVVQCSAALLTAGLDARAAAIVMRVVRNIVNTGRTIACTIHQPAIDIFEVWVLTSCVLSTLPVAASLMCEESTGYRGSSRLR